jgi:hypothetical protein
VPDQKDIEKLSDLRGITGGCAVINAAYNNHSTRQERCQDATD